jgi:branched-chain amino acid transport system substrate-binding protein
MKKGVWLSFLISSLVILAIFALNGQTLAQAKPIKIGVIGPMSHASGKAIFNGVSMASDEINQSGGINVDGQMRPIQLIRSDSNELASVTDAATAVERLLAVDKVDFLIGGWKTDAVIAMVDNAVDYKKIMITEGTHTDLSKRVKDNYNRYKYWFSAYFVINELILKGYMFTPVEMVRDIVKRELGIEKVKIALLLDKSSMTDPIVALGPKAFEKMGCEVVGIWRPSPNATDVSAELLAIKNSGAHIIFVLMYGPAGLPFSNQWATYKVPAAIVGAIGEATYSTFWKSTSGKGEYVYTGVQILPVAITDKTIPFYDKYTKTYDQFPDIFSAYFYDNVYRLKAAIEKARSIDSDKVVPALEQLKYAGAAGTYSAHGMDSPYTHFNPVGPEGLMVLGAQWQKGKLVGVWPPLDGSFQGLKYKGTVPFQLPPWMVEHYKKK